MMPNALPVSSRVNVTVTLTPTGAQSQNLSSMLVLGASEVIDTVERLRSYSGVSSVAADFGTTAPEYLAAVAWFSQSPKPTDLKIGRWVQTASKGGLRCAPLSLAQQAITVWQAVTSGGFSYKRDGGTLTAVAALNFSGAANLNAVASIIQTAMTGVAVVWNATLQRFEFTSNTTGGSSSVDFLVAPGSGTDVAGLLLGKTGTSGAYLVAGQATETLLACTALMDDMFGKKWYGLTVAATITNTDHVAVAGFIEAATTKHTYWATTQEGAALIAAQTSDLASMTKAQGLTRTSVYYSSTSLYAAVEAAARIMTTDYSGSNTTMTLMYKRLPGIAAEALSTTAANALKAKNCNVFVNYDNDTAIIQFGTQASGDYTDEVLGTDWLALDIQTSIWNRLYGSATKVPQTDPGVHTLVAEVERSCGRARTNGLIAPGVWNSDGFGAINYGDYLPNGFYVWTPGVDTQSTADRTARKAPPIQVAVKLAGAIHDSMISVVVNK